MNKRPLAALCLLLSAAPASRAQTLESAFKSATESARLAGLAWAGAAGERDTEQALLALLEDRDPAVRAQAAKALRSSAPASRRVEERLREVAASRSEVEAVRVEAFKSLAFTAGQSNAARRDIIAEAEDARNPDRIRALACKALWASAGANDARNALLALLDDSSAPVAVRAGAAWGLWRDAAMTGVTQRALVAAVSDASLDPAIRLEAVKSLYDSMMMGPRAVREAVQAVADSAGAPVSVRVAAVLAHHRISTDSRVRTWLADLASSPGVPEVRMAAIQAQTLAMTPELARYFHVSFWGRHRYDPLESE